MTQVVVRYTQITANKKTKLPPCDTVWHLLLDHSGSTYNDYFGGRRRMDVIGRRHTKQVFASSIYRSRHS